jgi:hypothetical protein
MFGFIHRLGTLVTHAFVPDWARTAAHQGKSQQPHIHGDHPSMMHHRAVAGGARPQLPANWARLGAHPGKSHQPHVHMHGELSDAQQGSWYLTRRAHRHGIKTHPTSIGVESVTDFAGDGDDPIDGVVGGDLNDPTEDLSLPEGDPWGVEAADVVDADYDPIERSNRMGSVENVRLNDDLRPTFGLEDEYYSGFGPASLMGCEKFG